MKFGAASRIGNRISTFVGGQSAVQLLNAVTGLALLRLLAKPEFAIYSVVLGIQTTINMLTDVGFGSAITNRAGNHIPAIAPASEKTAATAFAALNPWLNACAVA